MLLYVDLLTFPTFFTGRTSNKIKNNVNAIIMMSYQFGILPVGNWHEQELFAFRCVFLALIMPPQTSRYTQNTLIQSI